MDEIEIAGHHLINFFACFLGKNPKKRISKLMDITRRADLENRQRGGEEFYGEEFIENAGNILKIISRDPEAKIKLVTATDDFCEECRQLKLGRCRYGKTDAEEDREFIEAIGCEVNAVYSFDELLKKGKEFIRPQENQIYIFRGSYIFRSWIGQKLLCQIKSLGD